jgi:hypothetical protein
MLPGLVPVWLLRPVLARKSGTVDGAVTNKISTLGGDSGKVDGTAMDAHGAVRSKARWVGGPEPGSSVDADFRRRFERQTTGVRIAPPRRETVRPAGHPNQRLTSVILAGRQNLQDAVHVLRSHQAE